MISWFKLVYGFITLANLVLQYAQQRQLITQAEHAQLASLMAEQDKIIAEANAIRRTPIPDGVPDEFNRDDHPGSN